VTNDLLIARLDKTLAELREQRRVLLDIADDLTDYAFTQAMAVKKDTTLTYEERVAKAKTWEYIGDQFLDARNDMTGDE